MWNNAKRLEASARLKLVPLRGKIDKASVHYTLFRTDKADDSAFSSNEQLGSGKIEIESPFDAPIEVESKLQVNTGCPGLSRSWYEYVCDTPVDVIKKQCKLCADSPILTIGGKEISIMTWYEERPSYVYHYKEATSKGDTTSSDYKLYRNKFIRECIDRDYAEKPVYLMMRNFQMLYEYNPLAFSFHYTEEFTKRILAEWGKEPLE